MTSNPDDIADRDFISQDKLLVLGRYDIAEPSSSVNELLVNVKAVADNSFGFVDTYLY